MNKKLIAIAFAALIALTGCSTATVEKPAAEPAKEASPVETKEPAAPKEGTRENPYPIGSAITDGDWTATINSVNLDGTQAVMDTNPFNETPAEGTQYILVNVTLTYNGDNPDGSMPMMIAEYVTVDGNTINSFDKMVLPPEQFDNVSTLYTGASTTGNLAFEVPSATASEGVLAVKADMMGDKVFVKVQ
ncbi:DUF4352 domain-containing protein [Leucobacter sp. gxy201]|uniref:DUF4352 domain-containing protein n=1 Tax=Leucobacter sp. gxy201 TaxID=2957200 RepID=UPI003DA005A6